MEQEAKLSLFEHLQELRSRLFRIVLAVLVLGGVAIAYAREVFGFLMAPVLAALPEGSRALVYTSGIEEVNVLIKVGLYTGLFLAIPVALHQLWLFVAPGLLRSERRLIGPFVVVGTLFFVAGATFCYYAVLPTMFQFLLSPQERTESRQTLAVASARADDAARLLWLNEPRRAQVLAASAQKALPDSGSTHDATRVELIDRASRLGRLLEGAVASSSAEPHRRPLLLEAIDLHQKAQDALAASRLDDAERALEQAAHALGNAFDPTAVAALWRAERELAAFAARSSEREWTRPMLSMSEQLSLVLILEVAFGLIFELPLLMALLAMMGVLRFSWVAKGQRYAVLGCVAVAALITPTGDIINLSMMAIPMVVCYELGVLLVYVFERRRARGDEQEPAEVEAQQSP